MPDFAGSNASPSIPADSASSSSSSTTMALAMPKLIPASKVLYDYDVDGKFAYRIFDPNLDQYGTRKAQ